MIRSYLNPEDQQEIDEAAGDPDELALAFIKFIDKYKNLIKSEEGLNDLVEIKDFLESEIIWSINNLENLTEDEQDYVFDEVLKDINTIAQDLEKLFRKEASLILDLPRL